MRPTTVRLIPYEISDIKADVHQGPEPSLRPLAIAAVCLASFSGILVHLSGAGAFTAAFFRSFYAIPALLVLAVVFGSPVRRSPRMRLLALAAGLLLGIDLAAFHGAIGAIGAGPASVLAQTQVVFVGVLAWLIDGERPRRTVAVAVPLAAVGIVLLAGAGDVASAFGDNPGRGCSSGSCRASRSPRSSWSCGPRAPRRRPRRPPPRCHCRCRRRQPRARAPHRELDPNVGLSGHGWLVLLAWEFR